MVLIFILIYFEWRVTANQQFILLVPTFRRRLLCSCFLVLVVMELSDRELCDALEERTMFDVSDFVFVENRACNSSGSFI